MKSLLHFAGAVLLGLLLLTGLSACRPKKYEGAIVLTDSANKAATTSAIKTDIGFRSRRLLEEHYAKHGREFGSISQDEYLQQAQTLRDAPAGGDILVAQRADGVTTRFDRRTGAFLAYNEDFTIRTYFKPNDGERYFQRQLKRRER